MGTEANTSIIESAGAGGEGAGGKTVQAPGQKDGAGAGGAGDANLTPEQKAAAEKTAADAKVADAAKNAELDIKLPDGFKPDAAALGDFKKLAKEIGLDSEKASKVFGLYAKFEQTRTAAQETALDQQEKSWTKEIEADKELGGNNLKSTLVSINKALVGMKSGEAFKKMITEAGLGSHPAAARFLNELGSKMGEDKLGRSGAGAGDAPPSKEQQLQERFPKSYELMNGKPA